MLIEIGPEFHCLEGKDFKNNVYKIGPEFQFLKEKDKNSSVYENRARIPMFGRIK